MLVSVLSAVDDRQLSAGLEKQGQQLAGLCASIVYMYVDLWSYKWQGHHLPHDETMYHQNDF